jgi:hypothetical protein
MGYGLGTNIRKVIEVGLCEWIKIRLAQSEYAPRK